VLRQWKKTFKGMFQRGESPRVIFIMLPTKTIKRKRRLDDVLEGEQWCDTTNSFVKIDEGPDGRCREGTIKKKKVASITDTEYGEKNKEYGG